MPIFKTLNLPLYKRGPKNSRGFLKKHYEYLKYSYKFENLVPFRVLPPRLDAAMPMLLPLLETFSKFFNGSAVKGRQRSP
jgi:hypothetical protein